jgi:hypothetical protein
VKEVTVEAFASMMVTRERRSNKSPTKKWTRKIYRKSTESTILWIFRVQFFVGKNGKCEKDKFRDMTVQRGNCDRIERSGYEQWYVDRECASATKVSFCG